MVILGLILLIIGLVANIGILWTIGIILLDRRPDPELRPDRRHPPPYLLAARTTLASAAGTRGSRRPTAVSSRLVPGRAGQATSSSASSSDTAAGGDPHMRSPRGSLRNATAPAPTTPAPIR